jgi:hypothetical protein
MRASSSVLAALLLLVFVPTLADVREAHRCFCPQTSEGWILYDDNSRRVPDFLRSRTDVEVKEILVCEHGMHFFFNATQDGQPYYVSIVIVRPVPALFRTRDSAYRHFYRRPGQSIETRSRCAMRAYEEYVGALRELLGDSFTQFRRIQFVTDGNLSAPRLYVEPPLRLQWRGRTIELRGYVDVYFSAVS